MKTHTEETQKTMTPEKSLQFLKEGNIRFQNNLKANRNFIDQVNATANGQFPFATILSCIDSRVPAELVFDQGIGDIFSIRIAGNFINEDILGSMEFACKLAGTKLVMVLGHTSCGAIKGACDNAKLGNLTQLIAKITPAVEMTKEPSSSSERNSSNTEFVDQVSKNNILLAIDNIRKMSPVLTDLEEKGEIKIVGGMYNLNDGSVEFYD